MRLFAGAMDSLRELINNKNIINAAIYMVGDVIAQCIGILVLPVFTRYLSADDFGIYYYAASINVFVQVVSVLCLNSFVIRHYFELRAETDKKRLLGTCYYFVLIYSLVILFVALRIGPFIVQSFQIKIPFYPYIKIALIVNFLDTIVIVPIVYFRIVKKAWLFLILNTSKSILMVVVGLILVVKFNMGLMGRYYGLFYVGIVYAVICAFIMIKISVFSFDIKMIARGLKFSLPLLPSVIASSAIVSMDRFMLERYVKISDLGIYAVGSMLGLGLTIIAKGFYQATEPNVFEAYNSAGFNEKIVKLKNKFFLLIIPFAFVLIVFCRELIELVTAKSFYECYKVIPFFIIGSVFYGIETVIHPTLHAMNKTIYQPLIMGVGLIANLIANLLLIPHYGITGCAIASMLAFWTMYASFCYVTGSFLHARWDIWHDTMNVCIVCILGIALLQIRTESFFWTMILKITGTVTAAGLFYRLNIFEQLWKKNSLSIKNSST